MKFPNIFNEFVETCQKLMLLQTILLRIACQVDKKIEENKAE